MSQDIATKNPDTYKAGLNSYLGEFAKVLPSQIEPERFVRICLTALSRDPTLMTASVRSFIDAATQCATDGLMPDGKDAALVLFKSKNGAPQVAYMPMISGLVRIVHQSGKVKDISIELVHQNDKFRNIKGDNAELEHEVIHWNQSERGPVVGGYAVVHMMNGGVVRETMSLEDINKIKKSSRAQKGYSPWNTWWNEMARKSIFRRVQKWLPKSREGDSVAASDEVFHESGQAPDEIETIEGEAVDLTPPIAPIESDGATEGRESEEPEVPEVPEVPHSPEDDLTISREEDDLSASPDEIMDSFEKALLSKQTVADIEKLVNQYTASFKKLLQPDQQDVRHMIAGAKERVGNDQGNENPAP